MCARPASELWAAGFRDVCRPWACACGDAHPMGQPGGACFSPPSHRTSRLRAEPTRTPHVHPCYHPCRTCCASPRPPRARLPATDGVGKAGVALGVECVCVYVCVCVRPCVRTYCVFIGVLAVFSRLSQLFEISYTPSRGWGGGGVLLHSSWAEL